MIEASIISYILQAGQSPPSAIEAMIGNRIYADCLPQTVDLPAAVYFEIAASHPEDHDGPSLSFGSFQISCYGATKDQAGSLALLIRLRMQGRGGAGFQKVEVEDGESGFEPDTRRYRHDLEIRVAYKETAPA